jgi:hypothetical protein
LLIDTLRKYGPFIHGLIFHSWNKQRVTFGWFSGSPNSHQTLTQPACTVRWHAFFVLLD